MLLMPPSGVFLRRVPFREWRRRKDNYCITPQAREEGRGVMFDLQWAIDCAREEIPITVDARIFLLHVFKTAGAMQVGKNPAVQFIPAEKRTKEEMSEIEALLEEIKTSAWKERKLSRNNSLKDEYVR